MYDEIRLSFELPLEDETAMARATNFGFFRQFTGELNAYGNMRCLHRGMRLKYRDLTGKG